MGKFTRKCPLCKTNFHNENIYHSAIVENLVYAYRRCIKSFQEIENHRSIFIKKLESVQSRSSNNELNPLDSSNYNSSNSNRHRNRLDNDNHNSFPVGTSPTNNNSNSNSGNIANSIAFPRSLSSQYRMPQMNEFFLPDEPLTTPKTPHELPHLESPHISLLNGSGNNTSGSNNNSNIATPSLSPTGDVFVPSFLDTTNNNLKSSHSHLLKPLDNKPMNLTPPHSTNNYTYNNCRSRGYSDTTNTSFFAPPSVNFHSSEKGNRLIDNSSTSLVLTPVEVVSTPTTINESENEEAQATTTTDTTTTTESDANNAAVTDLRKRRDNLNPYSTPPVSPERQQQRQAEENFTASPEYTYRRLTDDDKEDNYIVVSASPTITKNKRSIQLDSNAVLESNSIANANNNNQHVIVGSPLYSPNRKKPELKTGNSFELDKDDEDAEVISNVDSILDGIHNASDSMVCHNGDL